MKIKIVIAFFVIGMGLSLIGGVIAGNPFSAILVFSLLSSLVLAALVFGLLTFLEAKVPEFSDFLNQIQSGEYSEMGEDESARPASNSMSNSESSPMQSDFSTPDSTPLESKPSPLEGGAAEPKNEKPKNGKFGDHIIIDNIPIKNEPKLMAEAIRTIMAQDDMGAPPSNSKQK